MKNTAAIITVGTRDVKIDMNRLASLNPAGIALFDATGKPLPRVVGKLINTNYEQLKKHLQFPIIEPFVKWLRHNNEMESVRQIILVATDQNERQGSFRDADSIEFSGVLKKWLADQLTNVSQNEIKILSIEKNVADLDRQYDDFKQYYNHKPLVQLKKCDKVFVMNQGGIGSINTSVMLHALNTFGINTEVIGVNIKDAAARRLTFSGSFLKDRSRILGEELVKNHNYNALKLLQITPIVTQLAAFTEARLSFDFEAARIEAAQIDSSNLRDDAVDFLDSVNENEWEKVKEVYRNGKVMLEKTQYIDFLIRIFRVVEGTAQYHSLKYVDKDDFDVYSWVKWFSTYIDAPEQAGLKQHLVDKKIDTSRTPNIYIWLNIWSFFDQQDQPFFAKLQKLSTYRNNTIGAHGYLATSRVSIEEALAKVGLSLEEVIDRLDAYFGVEADEFSFENTQEKLLGLIART
jgi:hypothetical protein